GGGRERRRRGPKPPERPRLRPPLRVLAPTEPGGRRRRHDPARTPLDRLLHPRRAGQGRLPLSLRHLPGPERPAGRHALRYAEKEPHPRRREVERAEKVDRPHPGLPPPPLR